LKQIGLAILGSPARKSIFKYRQTLEIESQRELNLPVRAQADHTFHRAVDLTE